MLQIKNVTKTYCPKRGVPVKALDGVSLDFSENGLVFILGKSGSGKSTLLNLLGGLDKADSGEFIIKGKSSEDFSQADFDSYRNTFIGFIFQEYNILGEFTVAQNIALAMELQGKRATSEELSKILDEVDLSGFGTRKPNELSGGQRQRVAIARALIKEPEMIMADEPTGALDSKTGKQVLDTLKKLSKTKLVLVVSHDRDFAELYADRIIELKDGKVISDTTKKSLPPKEHSDGVSIVDGKLIQIKQGYSLTDSDMKLIRDYVSRASCDTIISVDSEKNEEIKKVTKINDKGGADAFLDTSSEDVKQKSYKPEDSRLIRSRLPYKNSFKIGASSLKAKPIRLIFTVFLCFIAFTLFGIADTMAAYNRAGVMTSSIYDSDIDSIAFEKQVTSDGRNYEVLLAENDILKIKQKTGIDVIPVFSGNSSYSYTKGFSIMQTFSESGNLYSPNGLSLYNGASVGIAEIDEDFLLANGASLVSGRLPREDHEIAIPKFIFDQYKLAGIVYYNEEAESLMSLSPQDVVDYGSVVNRLISSSSMYLLPPFEIDGKEQMLVRIVGIYDTGFNTDGYEDFLPDAERMQGSMLSTVSALKLSAARDYGLHTVIAVNQGVLERAIDYYKYVHGIDDSLIGINPEDEGGELIIEKNYIGETPSRIITLDQLSEIAIGDIIWKDGSVSSLSNDKVLIPLELPYSLSSVPVTESALEGVEEAFGITLTAAERDEILKMTFWDLSENSRSVANIIVNDTPTAYKIDYIREMLSLDEGEDIDDYNGFSGSVEDYVASDAFVSSNLTSVLYEYRNDLFGRFYDENPYGDISGGDFHEKLMYISMVEIQSPALEDNASMHITSTSGDDRVYFDAVGFFVANAPYDSVLVVSDEIYSRFGAVERGDYSFAMGSMPSDRATLAETVKFSLAPESGCIFSLKNEATAVLDYIGGIIETLSQVFLYIGIGFAVFAALMMFNFISVSVSFKKREIGILRAVGARSSDVFVIFLNESLIITAMNFLLSAVATGVVASVVNGVFRGYGIPVTVLSFGIRQIALLLGVGVLVAIIGSFFPVMNIAKKRPIDAIQNR